MNTGSAEMTMADSQKPSIVLQVCFQILLGDQWELLQFPHVEHFNAWLTVMLSCLHALSSMNYWLDERKDIKFSFLGTWNI